MGSKPFDGVWFEAYSDDHGPPHVHGFYAGVEAIVEFTAHGVKLSPRKNAIKPLGAKRSDVNKILRTADRYSAQLKEIWKIARGGPQW